MMLIFWVLMVLLLLFGVGFILLPLRNKTSNDLIDTNQENLRQIYLTKQQELQAQLTQGVLSKEQFELEDTQLKANLLSDIEQINSETKSYPQKNYFLSLIIAFIVFFAAFVVIGYQQWGDSQALKIYYTQKANAKVINKELAQYQNNPQALIIKMESVLQQHPNSAQGWYLLGRLYMSQQQMQQAENAFTKAYQLEPMTTSYALMYAEALFFNNHQKLTKTAKDILLTIVKKDPNNVDAINILAIDAYHQHDYQNAIRYWEMILPLFDPNSQDAQVLLQAIADAEKKLNPVKASSATLTVQVTTAKALLAKIPAHAVLLVYAKAVAGPPMPLAVYRSNYQKLPITVTLTDAMSMLPQFKLSDFQQVQVFARISATGSAMPSKGDLIGQSDVIYLFNQKNPITIQIKQIV